MLSTLLLGSGEWFSLIFQIDVASQTHSILLRRLPRQLKPSYWHYNPFIASYASPSEISKYFGDDEEYELESTSVVHSCTFFPEPPITNKVKHTREACLSRQRSGSLDTIRRRKIMLPNFRFPDIFRSSNLIFDFKDRYLLGTEPKRASTFDL